MLDIGWSELLVIGVVALIVVGPKDLPKLFRALGQWVGRARGMARDFQRAMNEAADESGVSDIKKSFDQAASVKNMGLDNWDKAMPDTSKSAKPVSGVTDKAKPAERPAENPASAKKPATAKAEPKAAAKSATKAPAKKPASTTPAAKKPAAKKAAPKKAAPKKAAT